MHGLPGMLPPTVKHSEKQIFKYTPFQNHTKLILDGQLMPLNVITVSVLFGPILGIKIKHPKSYFG
jgi:hypothetical protein